MTTIHVRPPIAVLKHIEALKARVDRHQAHPALMSQDDTDLHRQSIAVLELLIQPSASPTPAAASSGPITAEKVAARLGGGPYLAAAILRATSGRPYWRLVSQAKSVDCPRCKSIAGWSCTGKSSCPERAWALAAAQRRYSAGDARVANVHRDLAASPEPSQEMVDLAINLGVIRLERVPGSDTEVQWVDAV